MKTLHGWFTIINVVVLAFILVNTPYALAGLVGSAHDFGTAEWSGGETCGPCHTPHNADTTVTDTPLWAHTLSSATYTMYDSPTLYTNASGDNAVTDSPREASKLCLSCHDGTVALDSFGGNHSVDTTIPQAAKVGIDLRDDHPVSVKWKHQTLVSGSYAKCGFCHTSLTDPVPPPVPFPDGYVECTSCHTVHNNTAQVKMLRFSLESSDLCALCHEMRSDG